MGIVTWLNRYNGGETELNREWTPMNANGDEGLQRENVKSLQGAGAFACACPHITGSARWTRSGTSQRNVPTAKAASAVGYRRFSAICEGRQTKGSTA